MHADRGRAREATLSRRWLNRAAAAVVVTGAALAVYAFWIEPQRLVVTRLQISVDGLKNSVRMMVIGDVQPAGPHEYDARIEEIVKTANAERADIVLLLGDYVSERALRTAFVEPDRTITTLGQLAAPMGVYAVPANTARFSRTSKPCCFSSRRTRIPSHHQSWLPSTA